MIRTRNLCKGGTATWVSLVLLGLLLTFARAKPATQPEQLADNQIGFSTQSDQRKQLMDVADHFRMIKIRPAQARQLSPPFEDLNSTAIVAGNSE